MTMDKPKAYLVQYGKHWYIRIQAPNGEWISIDAGTGNQESAKATAIRYGYDVVTFEERY